MVTELIITFAGVPRSVCPSVVKVVDQHLDSLGSILAKTYL